MAANCNELTNLEIIDKLNNLELRLSRLEANTEFNQIQIEESEEPKLLEDIKNISDGNVLESKIGEFGLAWLGNIVLFFGSIFIIEYIQKLGYQYGAAVFGYVLVAGTFSLAYFLKTTFLKNLYIFNLNAWLLLFYITIQLHFFTIDPVISSKLLGLVLLLLITAIQLFIAIRNKSSLLAGTAIFLMSIVAIVGQSTHFMLSLSVIITIISVLFLYKFGWIRLIYLSLILVYLINLLWFMSNPIMGNQMQAITVHNFGFIYIFIIAAIYSSIALINQPDTITKGDSVGLIVLNGVGFSMLTLLYVLSFFNDEYVLLMSSISVFCILFSILLKLRSPWKITAALYALYGFVTFSISIYGIYEFPRAYYLLAVQSLLVVSMAIWFRSKFIVIMNTLLFVTLLLSYLATSSVFNAANISFALVALITARILNWKKDRLTIKTDMLRNIYLLVAFVMVLFTLYQLMPDSYITLSWTLAAVIFFAFSLMLKNIKYRYMALASMIAAAFYFFMIDLSKTELIFRIIALLFLAFISIGLSIYYTRRSNRKEENPAA